MRLLDRLSVNFRYAFGIGNFLRDTISLPEAQAIIESQTASRDEAFLRYLEGGVYAHENSPYLRLLRHAGIDFATVRSHVHETGIEATLDYLHDAGVYVTQDELKGRARIVRPGIEFATEASDFDNPLAGKGELEKRSSGTSGAPTSVTLNLDYVAYRSAETLVTSYSHLSTRPIGVWRSGANSGQSLTRLAKIGYIPERYFTTLGFRWSLNGLRSELTLRANEVALRLKGRRPPKRDLVRNDSVLRIVQWLAAKRAQGTPAMLLSHVSPAVRICQTAIEHDLVGSSRVDLQACKLEYSIVSPK